MSCQQRVISTLAYLVGFGLVSLVMHEFFHFMVLRALGGDGYITFSMQEGFTHFTVTPNHVWAVHLSGGLLTGIFFLSMFWVWAWSSDTRQDTNLEVAAFTWGVANLTYAPIEFLGSTPTFGAIMFGIGFATAAVIYITKLSNWMATDSDRPVAVETARPAIGSAGSVSVGPGQR